MTRGQKELADHLRNHFLVLSRIVTCRCSRNSEFSTDHKELNNPFPRPGFYSPDGKSKQCVKETVQREQSFIFSSVWKDGV